MAVYYLCLTPDWNNRANGLFRRNSSGQNDFRFWYNATNGTTIGLNTPPAIRHSQAAKGKDEVGFAIEVTKTEARDDYAVTRIMAVCAPEERASGGAGANRATQASPFRSGGSLVCVQETTVPGTISINTRAYKTLGPLDAFKDGNRVDKSAYEVALVAIAANGGTSYEFGYDPEMDVDNA